VKGRAVVLVVASAEAWVVEALAMEAAEALEVGVVWVVEVVEALEVAAVQVEA
jgi:hypothetical protein